MCFPFPFEYDVFCRFRNFYYFISNFFSFFWILSYLAKKEISYLSLDQMSTFDSLSENISFSSSAIYHSTNAVNSGFENNRGPLAYAPKIWYGLLNILLFLYRSIHIGYRILAVGYHAKIVTSIPGFYSKEKSKALIFSLRLYLFILSFHLIDVPLHTNNKLEILKMKLDDMLLY